MRVAEFLDTLESGNFGIISAPVERFADLVMDVTELAQVFPHIGQPVILSGRYGGVNEKSVLVPGLADSAAVVYGVRYKQESIFSGRRGFIFTDDSGRDDVPRIKSQDVIEVLERDASQRLQEYDNGSVARLHDGVVLFSLGLDF